MKTMNQYADKFPCYEDTPKAVAAALAFSLAMRLCGDSAIDARETVRAEWETLFANGIVPQKPPARSTLPSGGYVRKS